MKTEGIRIETQKRHHDGHSGLPYPAEDKFEIFISYTQNVSQMIFIR